MEKSAFVLFKFKIQESLFWDIDWKNHAEVEECRIQSLKRKGDQEEMEVPGECERTRIHERNSLMPKGWSKIWET